MGAALRNYLVTTASTCFRLSCGISLLCGASLAFLCKESSPSRRISFHFERRPGILRRRHALRLALLTGELEEKVGSRREILPGRLLETGSVGAGSTQIFCQLVTQSGSGAVVNQGDVWAYFNTSMPNTPLRKSKPGHRLRIYT